VVVVVVVFVFLDRLEVAFVTVAFIVRDCAVVEEEELEGEEEGDIRFLKRANVAAEQAPDVRDAFTASAGDTALVVDDISASYRDNEVSRCLKT
jgi:hypothetical protein